MPRFFLHLCDGADRLLDPDGIELPDVEAAKVHALRSARDTLSNELRQGRLDLRHHIDVEDAEGRVIYTLPLEQTFQTIRHRPGHDAAANHVVPLNSARSPR